MSKFNPYFVHYAKSNGNTPEKQLEVDDKAYPGGIMCGFILWIDKQRQKFWDAHRECFLDRYTISDHRAWGNWLKAAAS